MTGLQMALCIVSMEELTEYSANKGLTLTETVAQINYAVYSCDSKYETYEVRAQRTLNNR